MSFCGESTGSGLGSGTVSGHQVHKGAE